MIVGCLSDKASDLPKDYFAGRARFNRNKEFPITVGRSYTVYTIIMRVNQLHYCICDNDYEAMNGLYYPSFTPAPLFSIMDSRLSKYWRIAFTPDHRDHNVIISFEDWINDPYFYDKLTDREENEAKIFLRYKNLIDIEE
jgi:hypothetical protein